MDSRKLVAWNLRKLRVAKGLSQEDLALEAMVARTYVSRLERSLENPTIGVLDRLVEALSANIRDLFVPPVRGEKRPEGLPAGRKARRVQRAGKRR